MNYSKYTKTNSKSNITYTIHKQTALDGKEWFTIRGKGKFSSKDFLQGKYKRLKDAVYMMEHSTIINEV